MKINDDLSQILKTSEIFAELSDKELATLAKLMEIIELEAGKNLFLQGSQSDALYVLTQGRLIAVLQSTQSPEKIVGDIHPGETIGELGLLSNQTRALTIRAARKSSVLKLSKESFEQHIKTKPDLLLKLVHVIVARSQQTIRLLNQTRSHEVIGLIPSSHDINLSPLLNYLSSVVNQFDDTQLLTQNDIKRLAKNNSELNELLDTSEKTYDYLLIEIDAQNINQMTKILEHCDKIVVIGKGNHVPIFSNTLKEVLIDSEEYKHIDKELALLYQSSSEKPNTTTNWLNRHSFKHHYHIPMDNLEGVKRFVRFLTNKAVGLVLSGGGVKGWAEVGVIKAVYETGINIDAIGGTSIGGLVSACYMMADNFDDFFVLFNKVLSTENKPFALHNLTFPLISILSGKEGTKAIQEIFGDQRIEDLPLPYFCVSCNLTRGIENVHQQGLLWKAVRASLSVPGLLPPVAEQGEIFVDGGIVNNLPVDVMRGFVGKGTVIAVDLSKEIEIKDYCNFPPVVTFWAALLYKLKVRKIQGYHFPEFYNTLKKSLLVGAMGKTQGNALLADILIKPDIIPYQNFIRTQNADKLIDIGYKDALSKFITLMKEKSS